MLDYLDEIAAERSGPELIALADRIERTGGCERPIRLVAEGEGSPSLGQPDRVLLVACKSRRETVCRPCSVTYRGDAKQLVRAGLEGGKGVPESVSAHPAIFLTLTAPSFGPVHRATGSRCHLGPPGRCEHGRPTHCLSRHEEHEESVGSPICVDCYDYEAAVMFNASVGELWRRVTIYARRHLAYLLGLTGEQSKKVFRLSYVKVAELQRRGVVHLHVVVRADSAEDEVTPPTASITTGVLADALIAAVRAVSITRDAGGRSFGLSFGEQLTTEALETSSVGKLASYLSKYLVKEASGTGQLDHRLREGEIDYLQLPAHLRCVLETAWRLGADHEHARLRRWAHALGFTGHLMTKSRRYSTTFLKLRAIRSAWRVEEAGGAPPENTQLRWSFHGVGHRKEIDAVLARTYRQGREASRIEYWEWRTREEAVA